ncbi:MAG: DUF296 domain-containing protein [Thermodesulfovibrionia bacterium]|nr:DUF296 domain-containing protein [Thermodesulfovibrionia bacterium]MCK5426601.1 DUF296 domain-containing protein [Thermodesulfovibrionia bacterium]MCK5511493.1 DUF296 domain-containing protein [Thermodesulfovibrionia bacterium]
MKYQVGTPGRIIVARLEDREDVLKNLTTIAKKENIHAAVFYIIGGMRKGRIVVGPEKDTIPPKPVWNEFKESHEVIGLGTIFWEKKNPKIHIHGAFGKKNRTKTGCLREKAETFLVLEVIIIEIKGIKAKRALDPISGISLLKL